MEPPAWTEVDRWRATLAKLQEQKEGLLLHRDQLRQDRVTALRVGEEKRVTEVT